MLEKEAWAIAPVLKFLLYTAGWVGGSHLASRGDVNLQTKQHQEGLKALEKTRAATREQAEQARKLRYTGTAALGGAAVGGLGSALWGKIKKDPSIGRDLLSTIAGAGVAVAAQELSTRSNKK